MVRALILILFLSWFTAEAEIAPLPVEMPQVYAASGQIRLYDGTLFQWTSVEVKDPQGNLIYLLQTDHEGKFVFPALTGESYVVRGAQPGYAYAPPEISVQNVTADVSDLNLYAGPEAWFPPECNAHFGEQSIPVMAGSNYTATWNFAKDWMPTNAPCWKDAYLYAKQQADGTIVWTTNDAPISNMQEWGVDSRRIFFFPPSPTPTPTPEPSPTPTPTPVPSPSPTPTAIPSPSPSPVASPTPCRRLPNGKCKK